MEYNGFRIEGDKTFGMFLIKNIGPGALPEILKGSFTKTQEAKFAIDQYALIKEERDNKPPAIKKVKLFPREGNDGTAESSDRD